MVFDKMKEVLAEQFDVDPETITRDTDMMNDLGADSLDLVELIMTLDPMNAYERHVIHTALQEHGQVSTFSVGSEPNRRVVVAFGESGDNPKNSGSPQYREWS